MNLCLVDDLNYLVCNLSFGLSYFGQAISSFTFSLFITVHFPDCKITVFACNIRRLDEVFTFFVKFRNSPSRHFIQLIIFVAYHRVLNTI